MADHDRLLQHWRDRSYERLAMARNAKEPQDRQHLLKVARSYKRFGNAGARLQSGLGKSRDLKR